MESKAAEGTQAGARARFGKWVDELRETGEVGQQQWEEILGRWGEQLGALRFDRDDLAQRWAKTRAQVGAAVGESLTTAQDRGTHVLLDLLAQIKASATALEARLAQDKPKPA